MFSELMSLERGGRGERAGTAVSRSGATLMPEFSGAWFRGESCVAMWHHDKNIDASNLRLVPHPRPVPVRTVLKPLTKLLAQAGADPYAA